MRKKCLILLAVLSLVFGSAQAGLWEQPLENPSFEDQGIVNTWSQYVDGWFEESFWGSYVESDDHGGIPDTPYGNIWAGMNAASSDGTGIYQQVGTWEENVDYTISFILGNRAGWEFGEPRIGLWVGGDPGSAVDQSTALSDIGATLIAMDSVNPWFNTDPDLTGTSEEFVVLNSGVGYSTSDALWLEFSAPFGSGQCFLDNVVITSSRMASDPVPANGATLVPSDQVLSWSAPTAYIPVGYDVYLSTDPNLPITAKVVDGENVTSYDPDLGFSTTYYWRVNAIDPNDGSPSPVLGSIWTFTTARAEPTITAQPVSITIPLSSTAEFTVEDVHGADYQWYRVNPDGEDFELVGEISSTLSISNTQVGDEGYYYCIVSNGYGATPSEQARLMIQRLVGRWKFEGGLTNEVAGGGDGTGDPNFVAGVDGSGLEFYGDSRTIVINDSAEYYNFYPQGMTVSVWVQTSTSTWDGVVAKQQRYDTWSGWTIDVQGGWSHFTIRTNNDLWGTDDDGNMFDGNWNLITGVFDPVTSTYRIYVDGRLRNEHAPISPPTTHSEPLAFGAETADGQIPYTGILDEVNIWNYALDPLDIAQQYVDYNPDADVCIENPELDFDGNCVVDIDDFASIAASWLECNIVPESECL
jgi:hypothetical protein